MLIRRGSKHRKPGDRRLSRRRKRISGNVQNYFGGVLVVQATYQGRTGRGGRTNLERKLVGPVMRSNGTCTMLKGKCAA